MSLNILDAEGVIDLGKFPTQPSGSAEKLSRIRKALRRSTGDIGGSVHILHELRELRQSNESVRNPDDLTISPGMRLSLRHKSNTHTA